MSDHEEIEEELAACLSKVLLSNDPQDDNDDGNHEVDADLVRYVSGMLAAKIDYDGIHHPVAGSDDGEEAMKAVIASACKESIDEILLPFLESMQCSESIVQEAERAASSVMQSHLIERSRGCSNHSHPSSGTSGSQATTGANTTRKLTQGMVSLSSDLSSGMSEQEAEANRYLWTGSESAVKATANSLIDAHGDKSSAKDKRKMRKSEAETARKMLAAASSERGDVDQDASGGLVRMNYRASASNLNQGADKRRDVLVRNVTVSLDNGTTLLESGELKFAYQRRYGLIGENGVGKSTLLKAIANQSIEGFPANLRVLHVRQEVPSHVSQDVSVTQAVLDSDVERLELLKLEKTLLKKLEQLGGDENSGGDAGLSLQEKRTKLNKATESGSDGLQAMRADLKKLDDVLARLQALRSDSAEGRAAMILTGLQFTPEMQRAKLSSLSGGWKMRVALAAALFIEPEICLLDEPTNHLDLEAVLWLESYLVTYKHTLVVVSHDRGFLNEVCTDVIEFKSKRLTYYRGNFDTYVKLRDANIQNAMRTYHAYQEKREHMMEFINKFRANAKRATMVQSRIKAVEKMDAEAPEPIVVDPTWRFAIPNSEPLGPPIIAVNDVYFDYKPTLEDGSRKPDDQLLLQCVNFGVDLTSRLAVLGPNGQGKTTLLNLIMGRLKPTKGSVFIHGNLRIGHFTQHSADNFNLKLSAAENLLNMFEDAEDQEIRTFLGKFQIQGNDALKPMQLLSGGQKSRVAFAALAYKKPHVLVIDEGSNHLSMEAVDALVEAVQDFKGGIMVVSHDEYFVSRTCSELWVVNAGRVTRFRGDFNDYKKHTSEETHKRVEESLRRLNAAS